MNQRCVSAAVVPDPNAEEEVFIKDRQLYLQATTRPGAKLPHAGLLMPLEAVYLRWTSWVKGNLHW